MSGREEIDERSIRTGLDKITTLKSEQKRWR